MMPLAATLTNDTEGMEPMTERDWLAETFEVNRTHLRAAAYRMLGSLCDAEDAVQEAWLRFSRADTSGVENLGGWLRTVVARVCLDMLRSRQARREEPLDMEATEPPVSRRERLDPEGEALLADSVGLALLVVLDRLAPAERVAFVLHDLFAVPFEEIAPIVGRSTAAARQLASRGRRRVRGGAAPDADLPAQRAVVDAFLAASRNGDFDALLALLDPDVVLRADRTEGHPDEPLEIRGAEAVAALALTPARRARFAEAALVNGAMGVIIAPRGRLLFAIDCMIRNGKIVAIEGIADPDRLRQLDLAVLAD